MIVIQTEDKVWLKIICQLMWALCISSSNEEWRLYFDIDHALKPKKVSCQHVNMLTIVKFLQSDIEKRIFEISLEFNIETYNLVRILKGL